MKSKSASYVDPDGPASDKLHFLVDCKMKFGPFSQHNRMAGPFYCEFTNKEIVFNIFFFFFKFVVDVNPN